MDKEMEYIEFEEGIFGFEGQKKFIPIMLEEDSDAVLYLQSLEDEELSFVIMNPFMLKEDYKALGTSNVGDLSYYVFCVVGNTVGESKVNLKCPIVVNHVNRKARQVILDSKEYGFRHLLKEFKGGEA